VRLLVLVAAAGLALAGPAAAAPADDGQLGVRLLEASVVRKDDPRARMYVVDSVKPGTTITRRIEVSHLTGDERVVADVYPGPADVRGGRFLFGPEGAANELTGWISVRPRRLLLDPGAAVPVEVTLAVPRRATAGERYAVVWARTESRGPGTVRQVSRVGIRVYLDVGPGGEAPSDFAIGPVTATRDAGGVPVLAAEVRNTGRRALDLTGSVALAGGPGGVRAGPFAVQTGTTLGVGERGTVRARLDAALPDGPWRATVTLRSGTVQHAVTVRLSFRGAPAPVERPDTGSALPPALLAGTAAALALLVVALAVRSRRSAPA
jgi:hypothetical protein